MCVGVFLIESSMNPLHTYTCAYSLGATRVEESFVFSWNVDTGKIEVIDAAPLEEQQHKTVSTCSKNHVVAIDTTWLISKKTKCSKNHVVAF